MSPGRITAMPLPTGAVIAGIENVLPAPVILRPVVGSTAGIG